MMFNEIALTFLVGVVGGLFFLWRKAQRSSPHNTNKGVAPAPSGTGATPPAGAGATTPAPVGTTTTITSTTTSSRTWWGISIKWWVVVALLIASLAVIWLSDAIVTLIPAQNVDWQSTMRDWRVLASVGVVAIAVFIATNSLNKSVTGVKSIPLIPLLWVGVVGYFLYQAGSGLYNWMSSPTERMQTVEFRSTNAANAVGRHETISVGPLEKWVVNTGNVTGSNRDPNGYWVCPSSPLSILQGRVFESRNAPGANRYKHEFTEEARLRLVQGGISSVTVTYTSHVGRPGRNSPCDQVLYLQ
ncbi:MAG: hypothetical protein ACK42D_03000 [Candidatus Paceibacteria bacterium]